MLKAKISQGATALKERDAVNRDVKGYAEHMDADVRALVEGHGCLCVEIPTDLGQTWD